MARIYLRTARRRAKLTQQQLASCLAKPQSFISKLERGEKRDVTRDEAVALGKALGVDPLDLLWGPVPSHDRVTA